LIDAAENGWPRSARVILANNAGPIDQNSGSALLGLAWYYRWTNDMQALKIVMKR